MKKGKSVIVGSLEEGKRVIATVMAPDRVLIEFHCVSGPASESSSWRVSFIEVTREQAANLGFGLVEMTSDDAAT